MSAMNVLIVEDDGVVRSALTRIAQSYFDEVSDVDNAYSAFIEINKNPPQVVVTDWDLGGDLSGLDVANYVSNCCPNCSLVLITGNSLTQLQALTAHLDVHAYLAKPFKLESIRSVLQELVVSE